MCQWHMFSTDRSGAENMERSCMYPAKKIEYGLVKVSTGILKLVKLSAGKRQNPNLNINANDNLAYAA